MPATHPPKRVISPARSCPVLYDVDVAIAGAGLCASFAAIAAGRCGARTLAIERMPLLGGNVGPGMILGGGLWNEADTTLPGGMAGIPLEFMQRLGKLTDLKGRPSSAVGAYAEFSSAAAWLLHAMMKEAGVEVLLAAQAADPIMSGRTVKGLFVEGRGGRFAVRAKVVIDGTGEAEIARRAGARVVDFLPIERGEGVDPRYKTAASPEGMIRDAYMQRRWPTYWNDTWMHAYVANVDSARFERFRKREPAISARDRKLAEAHFYRAAKALWPALARAHRAGSFVARQMADPETPIYTGAGNLHASARGLYHFRLIATGAINPADPVRMSRLEEMLRERAFAGVRFLRANAPGFEEAYLLCTQPFFGVRGGPRIEGEHTLTIEEMFAETRFPDVLYRNIHESNHGGPKSGFDVPYAITVPRGYAGLLVCGRGAAYERRGHDPTGMRARPSMMVFGQCVGTAAAFAARTGGTRRVDIGKVQKRLRADGVALSDRVRRKERT
jgi:hypothetical protein